MAVLAEVAAVNGFIRARVAKGVARVAPTPDKGRVGLACRQVRPREESVLYARTDIPRGIGDMTWVSDDDDSDN